MDDRDIEARLRSHLHATLDHAQPSPELVAGVRARLVPQPAALDGARVRALPSLRWGGVLAAAAAVVVIVLAAGGLVRLPLAGAATPQPSVATTRDFIVLPPTAAVPTKPIASDATDVLMARLRALGFGNFSSAGGYGITFQLDEPAIATDDQVRAVLGAPGVVEFVPLPAADYADVRPTVGQPLPKPETPLFGNDGVASVEATTDQQGQPALTIHLTPAAEGIFGDYTAGHVGESFAIVLDGKVASVPVIRSVITGGQVQVTGDPSTPGVFDPVTKAVLIGGPLPAAWRGAEVPAVIQRDAAVAAALVAAGPGVRGDASAVGLDARLVSGAWRAVWSVEFHGDFENLHCGATDGCPGPLQAEVVLIDAVNGGVMGYEAPSP